MGPDANPRARREPAMPGTLEEQREYLYETVTLKLHFLWHWLRRHPREPFAEALRRRVDIYRKTDLNAGFANCPTRHFDDPRWLALEGELAVLHARHAADPEASGFEAVAFERIRPLLDARAARQWAEPPEALAFHYRFGSLDYDPPRADRPGRIFLHIANALCPRSLFDDPAHLPRCFRALLHAARADGAAELETHTWLNSYLRWLAYFPPAWRERLGPEDTDVNASFAFWGQFLTARGTFNTRAGRHLRKTGALPFWPRHAWCRLDELERHLAARFPPGAQEKEHHRPERNAV